MRSAANEVLQLEPLLYKEDLAEEIHFLNEEWSDITDTLIAQLRSQNFENAELAVHLDDFYSYSLGQIECTRNTFPNRSLVAKLGKLFPLIPREMRHKVTFRDVSEDELDRIMRRIEKRQRLPAERDRFSQKRRKGLRV